MCVLVLMPTRVYIQELLHLLTHALDSLLLLPHANNLARWYQCMRP
jgi:hypothetical protein